MIFFFLYIYIISFIINIVLFFCLIRHYFSFFCCVCTFIYLLVYADSQKIRNNLLLNWRPFVSRVPSVVWLHGAYLARVLFRIDLCCGDVTARTWFGCCLGLTLPAVTSQRVLGSAAVYG